MCKHCSAIYILTLLCNTPCIFGWHVQLTNPSQSSTTHIWVACSGLKQHSGHTASLKLENTLMHIFWVNFWKKNQFWSRLVRRWTLVTLLTWCDHCAQLELKFSFASRGGAVCFHAVVVGANMKFCQWDNIFYDWGSQDLRKILTAHMSWLERICRRFVIVSTHTEGFTGAH